mgnify:CR=1 FL=1
MKKENFMSMILGTIGGILFAIGMCMCMIKKWNTFNQGIVVGAVGLVVLLLMLFVRRKMQRKPAIKFNGKTVAIFILAVVGALVLGVGMCMTMVWQGLLMQGIIVGVIGIVLLQSLIPICKGIK